MKTNASYKRTRQTSAARRLAPILGWKANKLATTKEVRVLRQAHVSEVPTDQSFSMVMDDLRQFSHREALKEENDSEEWRRAPRAMQRRTESRIAPTGIPVTWPPEIGPG
jgi:hypothetical protein